MSVLCKERFQLRGCRCGAETIVKDQRTGDAAYGEHNNGDNQHNYGQTFHAIPCLTMRLSQYLKLEYGRILHPELNQVRIKYVVYERRKSVRVAAAFAIWK